MEIAQIEDWIAIAAAVFGIVIAIKGLAEFRNSIAERRRELRWKKASTAKQLIDEIRANGLAAAALKMLDWDGADFVKPDGTRSQPIHASERRKQLRVKDAYFSDDDEPDAIFVRDCFDRLMEDVSLIENYIKIGLIDFADVEPFFRYYAELAAEREERACLAPFARQYGYQPFLDFCDRFVPAGPKA